MGMGIAGRGGGGDALVASKAGYADGTFFSSTSSVFGPLLV